ncbi:hypothetical protein DL764_005137 [Monosporascus ibericus]|uniref:Uncharacterized protein n=1 Tax=Monosporascus ibericus TaxID=155417 RepID=A0A4Q4TA37_9PEZI|nr:hypothetical protein DL764_005137 [Monosporascus ibericus]
MANRDYRTALKNVANLAYGRGTGAYSKDPTWQNTPFFTALTGTGKRVTKVKSASDYSYHANSYSFPFTRVVGDAASIRGNVDETTAAQWHTNKVRKGYACFLLVALSAYKQIMHQDPPVLSDYNEDNFDGAFSFFRPVIQGTVDVSGKLTQAEFSKTIGFLIKVFNPKIIEASAKSTVGERIAGQLWADNLDALRAIRTHHGSNLLNIDSFTTDVVDGCVPRLERGHLTLVQVQVKG